MKPLSRFLKESSEFGFSGFGQTEPDRKGKMLVFDNALEFQEFNRSKSEHTGRAKVSEDAARKAMSKDTDLVQCQVKVGTRQVYKPHFLYDFMYLGYPIPDLFYSYRDGNQLVEKDTNRTWYTITDKSTFADIVEMAEHVHII